MRNTDELLTEKLKEYVENVAGFNMCTPKDFDNLAQSVFKETGSLLSSTTLKRLWGYIREKRQQTPRNTTLNILSKYIGYTDFATFGKFQLIDGECESDFLTNNCLHAKSLLKGENIRLMWHPDRVVTIRHDGYEVFSVVESVNSKLSAGDTFRCGLIVEGEPLYLSQLIHEAGEPMSYVCGSEGGVKFRVL